MANTFTNRNDLIRFATDALGSEANARDIERYADAIRERAWDLGLAWGQDWSAAIGGEKQYADDLEALNPAD